MIGAIFVILAIIVFIKIMKTPWGKFFVGSIAKIVYSTIAFSLCMLIPIPIISVIIAIIIIIQIWNSDVSL